MGRAAENRALVHGHAGREQAERDGGGQIRELGSSNSVPEYVPLDNYNAMREACFEYGRYPIAL